MLRKLRLKEKIGFLIKKTYISSNVNLQILRMTEQEEQKEHVLTLLLFSFVLFISFFFLHFVLFCSHVIETLKDTTKPCPQSNFTEKMPWGRRWETLRLISLLNYINTPMTFGSNCNCNLCYLLSFDEIAKFAVSVSKYDTGASFPFMGDTRARFLT